MRMTRWRNAPTLAAIAAVIASVAGAAVQVKHTLTATR